MILYQYVFVDPFEEAESKEELLQDLYRWLNARIEVDQESNHRQTMCTLDHINSNEQSIRVSLLQKT